MSKEIPTTGASMELEPELTAQLKRVLSSLETLLPRPVPQRGFGSYRWTRTTSSTFLPSWTRVGIELRRREPVS